jgi:hypothetical protein
MKTKIDYRVIRKTLQLIKKLEAKAASTTFPEEAETARSMAAELRKRLAVWPDFPPPKPAPKTFILHDRTPEARRRGKRGVMSAVGKTKNVKPVTVAPAVDSIFVGGFGGFVTTPDDFVTPLRGRPRIYLSNAEKQAAYRKRKLLKSLDVES